jgi:nicotinate-nucleotide adenylyltransferase
MAERKVALLGGTYDPIHIGHTTVALASAERIGAEKVIFVVAKCSPVKSHLPTAGDRDRLAMVRLATSGQMRFDVSDYELKKAGPSYTIETVRKFRKDFGPDVGLYWLIGADCVNDMPEWHKIEELIDECNLSVMNRAGFEKTDFSRFKKIWGAGRVKKLERNVIETPLIDVSSTEIRKLIAAGRDVSSMVAPSVLNYIHSHNLYRVKEQ